jgi:hypothetical protein
MNKYEESQALFEKLSNISKEYNLVIITATQLPRPLHEFQSICRMERASTPIVIIDHTSLINSK